MASIELALSPRPPFRLDLTVWALRRRPHNRLDDWDGRTYRRALSIEGRTVTAAVTQPGGLEAPRLLVRVEGSLPTRAAAQAVRSTLEHVLGLHADLAGFYARARADRLLEPLAERYRGLKPPRFPTIFECLLNAVACQQLSLAAGIALVGRLAAAAGPAAGPLHACPCPADVAALPAASLRALGFSQRKAETLLTLAEAFAAGELGDEQLAAADDAALVARLTRIRGIGRWSADYVLLRGLGRLHVFPTGDVGALDGLRAYLADAGAATGVDAALARFAPYAGLVYLHLLLRGLEKRGLLDRGGSSTGSRAVSRRERRERQHEVASS